MGFFYQHNKPASIKLGKPTLTLQFQKKCCLVEAIHCQVATATRTRKSQPRIVVSGYAKEISIKDGVAFIFGD